MAFGIAAYIQGIESITVAEPLTLFHVVRITNLKNGSVSFTLPAEASLSNVVPFVGPTNRTTDVTLDMGGVPNTTGSIAAISINGRSVNVTIAETPGPTSISIAFFNGKGVTWKASN